MFPLLTAKQAARLFVQSTLMMAEPQRVIALRMAGMAGAWNVTSSEDARMVAEKSQAAVASGQAMLQAAMAGGSAGTVALAGLKPVRAKTRANAARLTERGPKLAGIP